MSFSLDPETGRLSLRHSSRSSMTCDWDGSGTVLDRPQAQAVRVWRCMGLERTVSKSRDFLGGRAAGLALKGTLGRNIASATVEALEEECIVLASACVGRRGGGLSFSLLSAVCFCDV